jgi:hypothetical protein
MEALDIREMAVPLNPTSTYESHLAARNGLELDVGRAIACISPRILANDYSTTLDLENSS